MKKYTDDIIELNREVEPYVLNAARPRSQHLFQNYYGDKFSPIAFVHASDVHNVPALWDRMVQYINHYSEYISFGIHTGDYCGGINTLYTDMYTECTPCVHPILNCVGNHDCAAPDTDWTTPCDKALVHSLLFNHTENWDVQFCPGTYPMSYYKDFEASNLRLIVLDLYYDIAQTRVWLKSILEDAKEKGLHVMTAMHEPTNYIAAPLDTPFHHYDDYDGAVKQKEAQRVKPSYDQRDRVTFEDIIAGFIENGGNYICNLAGHDHVDSFGYTESGVLNAVVQNATDWDVLNDGARTPGTKCRDCFNVVGVDTEQGLLKLVRIGNNTDIYLRSKNALCYDYVHRKFIRRG